MQHKCADSHQRTSALLGWSRGQNGLLGKLREGLEMSATSMVEMATASLERSGERDKLAGPHPTTVQNLQIGGSDIDGGIQSLWKRRWLCRISPNCLQVGCRLLRIVGNGDSRKIWGKPDLDAVNVRTKWRKTSCRGSSSLLMASNGVERWWPRVASIGVEWWTQVVQRETENDGMGGENEREREEFHEHFVPLSLFRIVAAFDLMSPW